ncbi:MAG: long-chain-fatty-acid--CoA ligase [Chthonomonadales bacterium]
MHLYSSVLQGAQHHPDRPAIYFREAVLTYAGLLTRVHQTARALVSLGIRAGDRVALLLPNQPEFTTTYYAVTAIGGVCVPANPLLKAPELVYIWGDAQARAVVTAPAMLPATLQAKESLPLLEYVLCTGTPESLPPDVLSFDEFTGSAPDEPLGAPPVPDQAPAVTIYTSGTEGRPKGALLSHRNLTANCRQVSQALHFDEKDNFLCVLPLFHSFAGTVCQNTPLFCGSSTTIIEMFHPARVMEAIERYHITVFAGVPAMYAALLQYPMEREYDLSSLRVCVSGGAPMPVAVMQEFEQRFHTTIIEGDGPTECSPVTSVNPLYGVRKPGTIGLPIPGVEMRIFDDEDRELPPGQIGEIVVRGENVMLGYHNQPEATARALRNGWYHTGDLGIMDEDGYFTIVDRKKDMLIVGGINVYPREVEEVLFAHPAVADAAVIGAPDALRGETVIAVVVLKPGAQATSRDIIRFCRERLANYKVPRRVIFRDSLPRGGTGKVIKRLLRKELEMETASQPEPGA